jgi:hypothetical protein
VEGPAMGEANSSESRWPVEGPAMGEANSSESPPPLLILMIKLAAFLPLKIAHVFLNLKNSLRSNSLRFYTENFSDFLYAAEKNASFIHQNYHQAS